MTVKLKDFGKDHWSTFAYLASCVVGAGGRPDLKRMRCEPKIHPGLVPPGMLGHLMNFPPALTRLKGREMPAHIPHDDWSCAEDIEAAGLLVSLGTGIAPVYDLTAKGWKMLQNLLAWKRGGGTFGNFGSAS